MIRVARRSSTRKSGPGVAGAALLKLPFLKGVNASTLARLAGDSSEIIAPRGTVLFRQGEPCRGLYVLEAGQVKLALATPQGSEKVMELVEVGQCLDGSSICLGRPHMFCAETLVDSRLILITKEGVLAELEFAPDFTFNFIISMSHRLHHLIEALEACTLRSGLQRVAGYLANCLPGDAGEGAEQIVLPAKKAIIASQLNLTQEHFSRILRELADDGLIEVESRKVHILNAVGLRARAH